MKNNVISATVLAFLLLVLPLGLSAASPVSQLSRFNLLTADDPIGPAPFMSLQPDLQITGLYTSPASPHLGDTVTLYVLTSNTGSAYAGNSVTYTDLPGGLFYVGPLFPGNSSLNTTTFPCNTSSISIHAYADAFGNVNESNESNNAQSLTVLCSSQNVTAPDLTVTHLWVSNANPVVGDSFTVYETTQNIGSASAGASYTRLTHPLGFTSFYIPSLSPGQTANGSYNFTCTASGLLAFSAQADIFGNVNESNESNNLLSLYVNCAEPSGNGADLRISQIAFSNNAPRVGDSFFVYTTTQNTGNQAAGPSVTEVSGPYGVVDFALAGLSPNQSVVNVSNFTCNQTGTLYFGASADRYNQVTELNEFNNYAQANITCLPPLAPVYDLAIESIDWVPTSPQVGQQISVTAHYRNLGDAISANFCDRLWIYPGTGDTDVCYVHALAHNQAYSFTRNVTFNLSGNYQIAAYTDFLGQVSESNEGNNNLTTYLSVSGGPAQPDLVISNIGFSTASPIVGQTFQAYITTANTGPATAGNSLTYYSGPWYSGSYQVGPLASDQTHTYSLDILCNLSGWHSLYAAADAGYQVAESNESNNLYWTQYYCAPAPTNCTQQTVVVQPDASVGKDAFVSSYWPVSNFGSSIDLRAKYGIYGYPSIFEESFLQFPLPPLPANATNVSARLGLYRYFYGGSGTRAVSVSTVNQSWNESTLTWSNKPADNYLQLDKQAVDIGSFGWTYWNVGSAVTSWYAGSPNYGLHLISSTPVDRFTYTARFYSSDYAAYSLRPKLEISYCA